MSKNGKFFSIIHEGIASCSKPKLACFVFNNRINFIRGSIRKSFPCPIFIHRISIYDIIPKGFPIITACAAASTEPNIAGFIFINTSNLIIKKALLSCKITKGYPIIIVNT